MKLLTFSDLHRDQRAARNIVRLAAAADVVIGAGDFATTRRGLQAVIDTLATITQPSVLVAGNSETTDELTAACRQWPSAHVLHGSGVRINDVDFWGVGGAVPVTPFGSWSYDLSEDEAEVLLTDCPRHAVLVTHSPPQGILDVSSSGLSLGSVAIRAAMDRVQPPLVVCGHIHASGGRALQQGRATVVNAGPAGMVCELTADQVVVG